MSILQEWFFTGLGGQLQGGIPCLYGFVEALYKFLILELFLKISIEVCFSFHRGCLADQFCFLSRTIFRPFPAISLPKSFRFMDQW